MVARNYYFFAHFTERKLNVREIFLLKRGVKIRLRETGKRVKLIFCLDKTFLWQQQQKKPINHTKRSFPVTLCL